MPKIETHLGDIVDEMGFPTAELEELVERSHERFRENDSKNEDWKAWLDDEARWHIWKANDELFQARDHLHQGRKDQAQTATADALNHMLFALEIVEYDRTGLDPEPQDHGVASIGGLVCQNFEEHDEEVKMQSGPYDGLICPECGRAAGGPDTEIPYIDEDYND